jgi:hypothetical protein
MPQVNTVVQFIGSTSVKSDANVDPVSLLENRSCTTFLSVLYSFLNDNDAIYHLSETSMNHLSTDTQRLTALSDYFNAKFEQHKKKMDEISKENPKNSDDRSKQQIEMQNENAAMGCDQQIGSTFTSQAEADIEKTSSGTNKTIADGTQNNTQTAQKLASVYDNLSSDLAKQVG